MDKKVLAWQVDETSGECSEIVFHHHGLAARRIGANILGTDFDYVCCFRVPEYDKYAEQGFVPKLVRIEDGWWFSCGGCQLQIGSESYYDNDEPVDLNKVVICGHDIYCNSECKDKCLEREMAQDNRFFRFKRSLMKLRPDLTFTEWTGMVPWVTISAKFTFPSSEHGGGTYRDDEGIQTLWMASGDKEAWDLYEAARDKEKIKDRSVRKQREFALNYSNNQKIGPTQC